VSLTVPELGGALGRVAATRPSREGPALDGIRIILATDLFVAAGEARDLAARGDTTSAVEALNQEVWTGVWERAVSAAGQEISDRVLAEFQNAAVESRMPRAYLTRWTPTEPERRAIRAHLGKGTRRLELALEELTAVARRSSGARQSTCAPGGSKPRGSNYSKPRTKSASGGTLKLTGFAGGAVHAGQCGY